MVLIKSISGIRGTLGDDENSLNPTNLSRFVYAFSLFLIEKYGSKNIAIAVGRDGRESGEMFIKIVNDTLSSNGINVVNIDLNTTPTTQLVIIKKKLQGGIMLTASHNPKNWNALKFFNEKGEFLSHKDVNKILKIENSDIESNTNINDQGIIKNFKGSYDLHINEILNLKHVNSDIIRKKRFKIVVDGINSSGGIIIPKLLEALNVEVIKINCIPDGNFAHDPEPLDKNLDQLKEEVLKSNSDLGIAVDPDVDRLVFVSENGETISEENTLISCADYILSKEKGSAVSNLSSSMGLRDVCKMYGVEYFSSMVGEINVVEKMKSVNAIIGGEGNGGIIYPESHFGRDALVGIGLLLTSLALKNKTISELFEKLPKYHMLKEKIKIDNDLDFIYIKNKLKSTFHNFSFNEIDGLKIENNSSWVHVRKSNTEPIIRIYIESKNKQDSKALFTAVKKALR